MFKLNLERKHSEYAFFFCSEKKPFSTISIFPVTEHSCIVVSPHLGHEKHFYSKIEDSKLSKQI